jgi:serine/threonine-protein kinase RsbW
MPTRTFPGRYKSLAKIDDFISQIISDLGFSSDQVYDIRLALDEACTNIIEHGYGGEGKGDIRCSVENTEEGIKIILKDWGKKFDPDQIPKPDLNVELEDLKIRGLGLYLMKNLMDKIGYCIDDGDGNTFVMTKRK